MKTLYIIRGLPGSGKTTLAHKLAQHVFEGDDYFMVNGEYKYDASKIKEAHEVCRYNTETAMLQDIETIVVSNTFSRKWEFQPYYEIANIYNYTVIELTIAGAQFHSVHNVPDEIIVKMRERWEN